METKDIRFIDSKYSELFRIKDGESITVTFSDGSMSDRKCTYIDDYHTKIGYNVFHICLLSRDGLWLTGVSFLLLFYFGFVF